MKTIGLLGDMSWENTAGYYRMINEGVKKAMGGLHSAKIVLYSVHFDPVEKLMGGGIGILVKKKCNALLEKADASEKHL